MRGTSRRTTPQCRGALGESVEAGADDNAPLCHSPVSGLRTLSKRNDQLTDPISFPRRSPSIYYNNRLQMADLRLSAGGYVMPQIDDYQYDPLNRIQQVSESQQSSAGQVSSLFTQKYAYDRWGNRTIDVPGTTRASPA
ncbi:MAG: hypothetical protein IPJ07_06950 [Acidobacteria bacterium]|nr:hypothetical protein [Acidobacteriota bacterium]